MPYTPLSSPAGSATGGSYQPLSTGAPKSGYQPISTVGLLAPKTPVQPVSALNPTPVSTPATATTKGPFSGTLGGGYSASNITDPASKKPLLTYENQSAKASQLLSDRTAPTFDPTKPQKINPADLQNPRMKLSVSEQLRKQFGSTAFDELDHVMPLELAGSNNTSNLKNEKGANPSKPYSPSTNPTATDPIENQIAAAVHNGDKTGVSLADGWKQMAKAKGIALPEDGGTNPLVNTTSQQPPSLADNVQGFFSKLLGGIANTAGNVAEKSLPVQLAADIQAKGLSGGIQQFVQRQGANIFQTYAGDTAKITTDANGKKTVHIPSWLTNAAIGAEISGPEDIVGKLAGESNPSRIASILTENKITDEETAKTLAPQLAAEKTPQGIIKILSDAKDETAVPKPSETPKPNVTPELTETATNAGKESTAQTEKLPTVNVDKQAQDEAVAKTLASKGSGVKALDKETAQAYRDWVNYSGASNKAISGKIAAKSFEDLRGAGMDAVHAFQSGDRAGRLSDVEKWGQDLLKKEQDTGIPVEARKNYLPQYWANSDAEIKKAYEQYSGKALSLKPGFTKEALFPSYEEGIKAGLTPKYTNIPDMINARVRASEKGLADRNFYNFLTSQNLIQPSGRTGEGWTQLDPKFPSNTIKTSDGTIYHGTVSAPAPLAELINNQLRGAQGVFEKGLQATANFASRLKNVVLSAGVPGTAINLHGFNELAATVPEAVNQPSLFTSALQYMLYPKAGGNFIKDNLELAQSASRDGLTLGVEDHAFNALGEQRITSGPIGKLKFVLGKASDGLYSLFGKHDFEQMIPALKLKMYSDLKDSLIEAGQSATDAGRMAAEKANNTFGGVNYAALGRDKNLQNFLRAVVFAPDFWESRLRYAGSMGKSLLSSSDPLASTYRKAVATVVGSYVGMNLWNYKNSGKYMFQNPAGHQMDIWMGSDSQGKDVWLRPFGTDLDFVRLPLDIAKSVQEGDASPVTSLFRNRVSTVLQPIISAVANVDAYGNPIFGPVSQTNPASKQIQTFASTLPVVPQAAAGLSMLKDPTKSTFQSLSTAASLPLRFNAPAPGSNVSNLADMIFTVRPKLETQIKQYYLQGNDQAALDAMSTYNKNLLQATIQSYKDNGHTITDQKAFTNWLVNTTRANGGLKDVFLKPPGTKAMSNAQKKQGKPLFNKIFPSTIQ